MRLFRRRPDEAQVSAALSAALGQEVAYNHLQYRSGALSGTLEVAGRDELAALLRTAYAALVAELGDDAARVVVYLAGRTPDGATVTAGDLGLPVPPNGRDLQRGLGTPG